MRVETTLNTISAVSRIGGTIPRDTPAKTVARVVESCGMVDDPKIFDSITEKPASLPAQNPLKYFAREEPKTITRVNNKAPVVVHNKEMSREDPTTTKNIGIKRP